MSRSTPVTLHPYLASCRYCRDRWERARGLQALLERRDEEDERVGTLAYGALLSPFGQVWYAASERGVARIETHVDELSFCRDLEASGWTVRYAPSAVRWVKRELNEYFAGRQMGFEAALDLSALTPFRRSVLEAVAEVPWGEVRSYGDIAYLAGYPGAARAVGSTMASNPISIMIPCHRVIRSDGSPGEYGYWDLGGCGRAMKLAMLADEGVTFAEEPPAGHGIGKSRVRGAG